MDAVAGVSELLLTTMQQEISVARCFAVTAIARRGGYEEAQDRVRTLVSELVTDVVLHAGTPAVLTVQDDVDCVWILVTDGKFRTGSATPSGRRQHHRPVVRLLQTLSADSDTWPSAWPKAPTSPLRRTATRAGSVSNQTF